MCGHSPHCLKSIHPLVLVCREKITERARLRGILPPSLSLARSLVRPASAAIIIVGSHFPSDALRLTAIIGGFDDFIGVDGDGRRRRAGGQRRRGGDLRGRRRRERRRRVSQQHQPLSWLPPLGFHFLDWFRFSPSFFEMSLGSVAATFDAARPTLS